MAAPPTIGELANKLEEDHGYTVPLADIFRWSTPVWSTEGNTAAMDVGPPRPPRGGSRPNVHVNKNLNVDVDRHGCC